GGPAAGAQVTLDAALQRAGADARTAAALRGQANAKKAPGLLDWLDPTKLGSNLFRTATRDPMLEGEAQHFEAKSAEDAAAVVKAKNDKIIASAEEVKKASEKAEEQLKSARERLQRFIEEAQNQILDFEMKWNDQQAEELAKLNTEYIKSSEALSKAM